MIFPDESVQAVELLLEQIPVRLSAERLEEGLIAEQTSLSGLVSRLGDEIDGGFQLLGGDLRKADGPSMVLAYSWMEAAKGLQLLMRDCLFSLYKCKVMQAEGEVPASQLAELKANCAAVVREACEETRQQLVATRESAGNRKLMRQVRRWRYQANPWPVFKEQMQDLLSQSLLMEQTHQQVCSLSHSLKDLHQLVNGFLEACLAEGRAQFEELAQVQQWIHPEDGGPALPSGKLAARLADVVELKDSPDLLVLLEVDLATKWEALPPELSMTVGIDEGMLQVDHIQFRRSVSNWFKAELLPLCYEVWEILLVQREALRMAQLNIKNRAMIHHADPGTEWEPVLGEMEQLLASLKGSMLQKDEELQRNAVLAKNRLDRDLKITELYITTRPFLPVVSSSTMSLLRKNQGQAWEKVRDYAKEQVERVKNWLDAISEEEALTNSEKISRYIREKEIQAANQAYTGIFLTRGLVGKSFVVRRELAMEHALKAHSDWKVGLGGPLLLYGHRFSGKTTFGDTLVRRLFTQHQVRLVPGEQVTVAGRKFAIGDELGEALMTISRHRLQEPHMLWIDDLHRWWGAGEDPASLLDKLHRFALRKGSQFFIVVAMSASFRDHLEAVTDLGRYFHSQLDLSRMSHEEVQQAILLRHGATHRLLVDAQGNELGPNKFRKKIQAVYAIGHGIIGDVLTQWARATVDTGGVAVRIELDRHHELPDFLDADTGVLLARIHLRGQVDEKLLRSYFGPAFNHRFAQLVRELTARGILVRDLAGNLQINEVLVNGLEGLLRSKKYLIHE